MPIVQLYGVKPVGNPEKQRFKGTISDGVHHGPTMLTADVGKRLAEKEFGEFALLKLGRVMQQTLAGNKIVVILQLELVEQLEAKVGETGAWDALKEESSDTPTKGGPSDSGASPLTSGPSSRVAPAAFPVTPKALGRPTPIEGLNPYKNNWTIKARVMRKEDLRSVSTKSGEMSVFSMDLCDESGEIRASVWREAAVKIYAQVEEGKVYFISRGQLKMANKRYSTLNNEYEMSLGFDTIVQMADEQDSCAMPAVRYSFVQIASIADKPTNAIVDVLGVATSISPVTSLTSKSGKELTKRTVTLSDDSGASIEATIWGQKAVAFPDEGEPVVALKGMRVTEWNQKSLGFSQGSIYEIDPEMEAGIKLRAWWKGGGSSQAISSLSVNGGGGGGGGARDDSSRAPLHEVKNMQVSSTETEWANVRCYLSRLQPARGNEEPKPAWYAACNKCQKKLMGDEQSGFTCEACNWSGSEANYRYILQLAVVDHSDTAYITAFNDQATAILGKSASQLKAIKDSDLSEYEAIVSDAQWTQYVLRLRVKSDTYQDVERIKMTMFKLTPVDFAAEARHMLKTIHSYPGIEAVKTEAAC